MTERRPRPDPATAPGAAPSRAPGVFPSTRWTLILSARDSPEARRSALDTLLSGYWRPLYAFARRKGLDDECASDAVQGFMLHLLERDFLSRLDPDRGRMRSYLRTAMAHYLVNQYEREGAKKRGGDRVTVPFDTALAERTLVGAPNDPADAFDREWALLLMERGMERLQREFEQGKRRAPFEAVAVFFSPTEEAPSYKEVAERHGMSIPQLKSLLHRTRLRFRELVEQEVGETVLDPANAPAEVQDLMAQLGR